MALSFSLPSMPACVAIIGSSLFIYCIVDSYRAGLGHIPGPFLARFTDLYRLVATWRAGRMGDFLVPLHEKYGDVVRIGPRSVSVSDPLAIPTIYNTKSRLWKSQRIQVGRAAGRLDNIVTMRDPDRHGRFRRPIANAYALSTLIEYEPTVDGAIQKYLDALEGLRSRDETVDIARWTWFYAYDIVGELSFGKPIGFLEAGRDVCGLIRLQIFITDYLRLVMQMPWLHRLFLGNPLFHLLGMGKRSAFLAFTEARVAERLELPDSTDNAASPTKPDMLAYFIAAREKYPDIMTKDQITATGVVNVGAFSVPKALETTVRYLVENPDAQEKLLVELKEAGIQSPISFKQTQTLPYLHGLVREGIRLHFNLGSPLGRDVPAEGLVLPSGVRIPGGVEIGIKPHVLACREDVVGARPLEFRPERWMRAAGESQEQYDERKAMMDRSDMSFGYGPRSCIGKNIAMLVIYKVIADLVWTFKMTSTSDLGRIENREVFCQFERREHK